MRRLVASLMMAAVVFSLILSPVPALSAQNISLKGYSYGADGIKIGDVDVVLDCCKRGDNYLSGTLVLKSPSKNLTIYFSSLKPDNRDYIGVGKAQIGTESVSVNVAVNKHLDRVAGSLDYMASNGISSYAFVAGKGIPSAATIEKKVEAKASKTSIAVQPMGITGLADSLSGNVHIQVYGPNIVNRSDSPQEFQIRSRQAFTNESWYNVSSLQIWVNPPRNSGEGFNIDDDSPKSSSNGEFSVSIGYLSITIPTLFNNVTENHSPDQASWTINPTQDASHFYDGPSSSTNSTAVYVVLAPISGSGAYYCTGWVSSAYTLYDTLDRFYLTESNSDVPYGVTVQN